MPLQKNLTTIHLSSLVVVKNYRLLHISGPTCSGKTQLAHLIFQKASPHFSGIINCDSRQFYKQTTIATAKPSLAELQQYQYHFCNHLNINHATSAHQWAMEVEKLLAANKNSNFIVVGGPSLYSAQLRYRMPYIKKNDCNFDAWYQHRLNSKGLHCLLNELKKKDLKYYHTVDKKNPRRIIRALVQMAESGKSATNIRSMRKNASVPMATWHIIPPRKKLYEDAATRVYRMIENGLMSESSWLLKNGYQQSVAKLGPIGYQELFDCLNGKISYQAAIAKIIQLTRNLAKKQVTWIKKELNDANNALSQNTITNNNLRTSPAQDFPHFFFLLGQQETLQQTNKNPTPCKNSPMAIKKPIVFNENDYFGLEKMHSADIYKVNSSLDLLDIF